MAFSEKKEGIFFHTFIYSFGNFFNRGLNIILLPIYSHYISPSEFGVYSVIISVATIASTVINLGLPGIFVKNLSEAQSFEAKKKFISNVITGISLISIPTLFFVIYFSKQLSSIIIGSEKYYLEIILGVLSIYAINFSYYFSVFFISEQKSKKYVSISSISAFINFLMNIILVVFLGLGITGIFVAQIFSSMILVVLSNEVIKNFYNFEFDYNYLKPILVFSFPLLLSGIFTIIVELLDRFLILKLLNEQRAGIYSFGYRIALIYNLFVLSFKSAWIPHYFNLKTNDEEKAKHLGKVFTKLLLISAVVIFGIQILVQFLFRLEINSFNFFDKSYSESGEFIFYVMIGYFFSLLIAFYSIVPYKFNRTIHFFISDLIALVINLTLNLILIPKLGIKGSAIAIMFSFFGGAFYLFVYSQKRIKISYDYVSISIVFGLTMLAYLSITVMNNLYVPLALVIILLFFGFKFKLIGKNLKDLLKF